MLWRGANVTLGPRTSRGLAAAGNRTAQPHWSGFPLCTGYTVQTGQTYGCKTQQPYCQPLTANYGYRCRINYCYRVSNFTAHHAGNVSNWRTDKLIQHERGFLEDLFQWYKKCIKRRERCVTAGSLVKLRCWRASMNARHHKPDSDSSV